MIIQKNDQYSTSNVSVVLHVDFYDGELLYLSKSKI